MWAVPTLPGRSGEWQALAWDPAMSRWPTNDASETTARGPRLNKALLRDDM